MSEAVSQPAAPRHDALVVLDSDGTVFPNMEAKYAVMRDTVIAHWGLAPVSSAAAEAIRFVNLRSAWRGSHRFPGLLRMLEHLAGRPEPAAAGVALPDLTPLRRYVESGGELSHAGLRAEIARTGDATLERVLAWSEDLSRTLETLTADLAPFEGARAGLERIRRAADLAVVSQAPGEQIRAEWRRAGLDRLLTAMAGAEGGAKADQLRRLAAPYDLRRVLMVGDAPGDRHAAEAAGVLFFPVVPGREEDSWRVLNGGAFDRFLEGRYEGEFARALLADFESALPATPPWRQRAAPTPAT